MSIALEKVKFASERFLLVRVNPARYIEPVLNAGLYEMTFPFLPNKITRNGIELTRDASPPVANDHWYHNSTTNVLQVKLLGAPDENTNVLIAYYYLFYTGTIFRAIGEDPANPLVNIRNWEPKITTYPSFVQSFENILAGVFSISETTISLINSDGSFQTYLTGEDSFYNKQVDIWYCISAVENIQKVFTGTIQQLSLDAQTVNLRCVDSFNTLNRPALMGDDANECFFRRNLESFPDLDPTFHETPVPYIVGSSSRFKTQALSIGVALVPDGFRLITGTAAPCTSYTPELLTTNNRTLGACRMKGQPRSQTYGAVIRTISSGTGFQFVQIDNMQNVMPGNTFSWIDAAVTYYGIVVSATPFTYLGLSYNLIFTDPATPFTLTSVPQTTLDFGLIIEFTDETIIYPRYGRDYTTPTVSTSGGNKYVSIQFTNNFENFHAAFAGQPFDPNLHRVFFRASNTVVQTHADILAEMMGKADLVIEPTSFAAADLELPVNCRFHIPNFDEIEYKSYLENVQDVLKSSLGYLKINADFQVEYNILNAPSSSMIRDATLTIEGGTSCEIEYADIATTIIAYNPHNDSQEALDDISSPSETRQSYKAELLHGLVNVDRFRHVLEEITSNIDRHMAFRSSRRSKYTFQTATQDIETELGDDVELQNTICLGGSGSTDLKIISIEKSPEKISMIATDLKGL